MGRKTRILRRPNKFGLKYASHLKIRNNKEEKNTTSLIIEELPQPIKEEFLEPTIESNIIEENFEIKNVVSPKKPTKSKK